MNFFYAAQSMTTTSKKKVPAGVRPGVLIPFPADANSFSLQNSIKLSEKVINTEKKWVVTAGRSVDGTVIFFLEDEYSEIREIEWMKFHSAVLCRNWKEFDNLVKNVRADLNFIESKRDRLSLRSLEKFNELKKASDSELISRDEEAVELLKEVGPK